MKKRWRERSRGQALIMVTFALIAMMGLLGLAVDLGWSFFVRKGARSAADSAALAAVIEGMERLGASGTFVCGDATLACRPATPAGTTCQGDLSGTNLLNACLYAQQNGFQTGGKDNRQTVAVQADVPGIGCTQPNCVPTAPGVNAFYWVTVRVTETVPQLFSAVLGNPTGTVHARATAVITDSAVIGSLILLNRENDENPERGYKGVNFYGGGGPEVTAPGGILLASQCNLGNCEDGRPAGELQGGGFVSSQFTYVRGVGKACAGGNLDCGTGSGTWIEKPSSGKASSPMFQDPMRGKGQPPLATEPLAPRGIPGGVISGGTEALPTPIPCGNYFAYKLVDGIIVPTGAAITLDGQGKNSFFVFTTDSGCASNVPSGFGDWVFFGGLRTSGGAATVQMVPGRYVFAGQSGGETGQLFSIDNGTTLKDLTPAGAPQGDAGELLIYTDWNYPGNYKDPSTGLITQINALPPEVRAVGGSLFQFGQSGLKMGNNTQSSVNLHGLDRDELTDLGMPELKPFAPVVMWQDQQNSRVKYTDKGNIVGDGYSPGNVNDPENSPRRVMNLSATTKLSLTGAVYQPRGAWVDLQAGDGYAGPIQIVTGALKMQGGPKLTLLSVTEPIVRRVAALVE